MTPQHSLTLLVIALTFCVIFTFTPTAANPEPVPGGMKMDVKDVKCDGEPVTIPPDVNATLVGCYVKAEEEWAATGKKGFMPLQRLACVGVCAAQGMAVLDEAGKPIKDNPKIDEILKRMMPESKQKPVADAIALCVKKNSKKLVIKPGDCSSYGMMLFCMKESLSKICKF